MILIRFVLIFVFIIVVYVHGFALSNRYAWHRRVLSHPLAQVVGGKQGIINTNKIGTTATSSGVLPKLPSFIHPLDTSIGESYRAEPNFPKSPRPKPRNAVNKPKRAFSQSGNNKFATKKDNQKAKGAKEALRRPFVERLWKEEERKPLSDFAVGQKVSGRVISVVSHGIFADIGSTKDGLVHIKDMSKSYFMSNHESKFSPGQDIVAWVKFVDSANNKLGLQLFAPDSLDLQRGPLDRSMLMNPLDTLTVGQPISGTVVKVSQYGVDVDVGAEVLAFLQKRKIRLQNSKQARLKCWEIIPLGSTVQGYVYEVQKGRKRIAMTTFPPAEWELNIPQKERDEEDDDDDEELGGSVRAENLRALQRTLALGDDDDDEDDDDDDLAEAAIGVEADFDADDFASILDDEDVEEDDTGAVMEDFSMAEIEEISRARAAKRAALMVTDDDDDSEGDGDVSALGPLEEADELSIEELFARLSSSRGEISLKDIKGWDYMRGLLASGLDEKMLTNMFRQASRGDSKLTEDTFEDFLAIFTEAMGFSGDGDEGDDDGDGDDVDPTAALRANQVILLDDTKPSAAAVASVTSAIDSNNGKISLNSGGRINLDIDEFSSQELLSRDDSDIMLEDNDLDTGADELTEADDEDTLILDEADLDIGSLPIEKHFERKSKTNDLFQFVFNGVAGKKGYVTYNDVVEWDFARALVHPESGANAMPESSLRAYFTEAMQATFNSQRSAGSKDRLTGEKLDRTGFELLMDRLSSWDILEEQPSSKASTAAGALIKTEDELKMQSQLVVGDLATDLLDNGEGEDDDVVDGDELQIDEEFEALADSKGRVSFDAAMNWDLVKEMIDFDFMTKDEAIELYKQAAEATPVKSDKKVSKAGKTKVKLPDLTAETFAIFFELIAQISDERYELGDHEELVEAPDDYSDNIDSSSSQQRPALLIKSDNERTADISAPLYDDDEVDDQDLLNSVFDTLSNGKKVASLKDLLNWDFILELMSESALDEDGLLNLMKACGGTEKGITLEAFDRLVDQLVSKYKDHIGDDSGDDIDADETEGISRMLDKQAIADDIDVALDGDVTDTDQQQEVYEFDIDEIFAEISEGQDFTTIESLKNWDIINELFEEGYLDDKELLKILEQAGVPNNNKIDLQDFEAFINELDLSLEKLAGDGASS